MPPTTIVDADLSPVNNNCYAVLELDAAWITNNLSASGAATWTEILNVTSYPEFTELFFRRIKFAPNSDKLIYVIAFDKATDKCYMFRTSNSGASWVHIEIADVTVTGEEDPPITLELLAAFGMTNAESTVAAQQIGNKGGDVQCTTRRNSALSQWPEITGARYTVTRDGGVNCTSMKIRVSGNPMNWAASDTFDHACRPQMIYWNGTTEEYNNGTPAGPTKPDDGVYSYSFTPPWQPEKIHIPGRSCGTIGHVHGFVWKWEIIEYNGVSIGSDSCAFDIAKMNPLWMYVGLRDKVLCSKDGGFTWDIIIDDRGANDLQVNPLLPGVFAMWSTDGDLELIKDEVLDSTLDTGETAKTQPYRIAFEPLNGGKIWALKFGGSSFTLRRRYLGTWSDQVTGIAFGSGLITYPKGSGNSRVLYLDGDEIWYSDDDGVGFDAKKGDWAVYKNPIRIHLLL